VSCFGWESSCCLSGSSGGLSGLGRLFVFDLLEGFLVGDCATEERVGMVANVLSHAVLVRAFEEPQTGDLVQVTVLLVQDGLQLVIGDAVGFQQLRQVLVAECLEGASVVLTSSWCRQVDDLVAVVRLVVLPLSLLTVRVTNVVRVVLFELFAVDVVLLSEFLLPEHQRLFHGQSKALEEETQLKSTEMLQMVLVLESRVECLHAGRELLARVVVKVRQSDLVFSGWGLGLLDVKLDGVMVGQTDEHGVQTMVTKDRGDELVGLVQLLSELCLEVSRGDSRQVLERNISDTLPHEDLAATNQVESLFEGDFDEVTWVLLALSHVKGDVVLPSLPVLVALLKRLVVEVEVFSDQLEYLLWLGSREPHVEQTRLLEEEPAAELLVSAVSQTTDEVGDVVVAVEFAIVFVLWRDEVLTVVPALVGQLVLVKVLVDLGLDVIFLRCFLHPLDFPECLETMQGDLVELGQSDHVLWVLLIKVDASHEVERDLVLSRHALLVLCSLVDDH